MPDNEIKLSEESKVLDNTLQQEDWYSHFLEQAKATVATREFNARWEIVKGYHELGGIIETHKDKLSEKGIRGQQIIKRLSEHLNRSESTIYKAHQFYQKVTEQELLDMEQREPFLTWKLIVQKYLPEAKKEEGTGEKKKVEFEASTEKKAKPVEGFLDETVTLTVFQLLDLIYGGQENLERRTALIEDKINERFGRENYEAILSAYNERKE